MHFVKVRVPFLMHLYLPWQRVRVQLFTPPAQGTGRTGGAGVRGLQPRSNSSETSHFLPPFPFPLFFSVLPPFDLILREKSVTSAHYCS